MATRGRNSLRARTPRCTRRRAAVAIACWPPGGRWRGRRRGRDEEREKPDPGALRSSPRWGDIGAPVNERIVMAAVSARRTLLPLTLVVTVCTAAHAQAAAPAPSGATAAWTLRLRGDVRWQHVTPARALPRPHHAWAAARRIPP